MASGSKDPPGSYTPHRVLWPQDRWIHLDPTPLIRFCGLWIEGSTWILHPSQGSVASGSKDPPGSYTPHKVLRRQDRRIHLDPTPSQGSAASGSKDPTGSYTPHRVLWLQDRRIHLDPTPLTRFCGLRIVGSPGSYTPHRVPWPQDRRITWILHPS